MIAWLGSIVVLAFVMAGTPGPNNLLFAAAGARYGYLRAVPMLAGMLAGFTVLIGACVAGVGGLLEAVPGNRIAMTAVASAYMAYLGLRLWLSTPPKMETDQRGALMNWWQMALFQVVNPKTWLATLAFVTGRLGPNSPGGWPSDLAGAVCFLAVIVAMASSWTLLGAALTTRLDARHGRWALRAMAVLAVLTIVTFWW